MRVAALAIATVAGVAGDPCSGSGCFALYYRSTWSAAYLHYNAGPGWNGIPGEEGVPSANASFPAADGWVSFSVGGNQVTWVLTNGAGQWDNNGGKNYAVETPGVYSLDSGVVTTLDAFPVGCPASCSLHGACSAQYGLCTCVAGYFGWDCSTTCNCGIHGTCDAAGNCQCQTGWATCGTANCTINTQIDPHNCGACGVPCLPNPAGHIATATCSAGVCNVTCTPGFTACADGTCSDGGCPLPGCQLFDDNQCSGNDTETPTSFDARNWQTPARGTPGYFASFQDYASLQGYARLQYDATHTQVAVMVVTKTKNPSLALSYTFDGAASTGPNATYCAPGSAAAQRAARGELACTVAAGPIYITVAGADGTSLVLDEPYFIWGAGPVVGPASGDYRSGQKGAIVEMFGWQHVDVAKECATLAQLGYLGAKLWPVMEQVFSTETYQNVMAPWFFAYQPVSYRLQGRMGNSTVLAAAIATCRALGVRMYADAVINHMVGGGNDANPSHRDGNCNGWTQKNTSALIWANSAVSDAGVSPCYTQDFCYIPNANTNLPPSQEFPAVPYGPSDFHCERALNSWTDPLDLNAGWLDGLVDLNTEHPYVQQRIADYLTSLLSIGFSGFRIDAAKHIQPDDLVGILTKFKANLGGVLPADWVTWMEVLTGGEGDMLVCNNASGYNYGGYLEQALLNAGWAPEDVAKTKIWASYYPKEPGIDCGNIAMNRKAVQNDDADQQMPGSTSRDMGNAGCVLVSDCSSIEEHRQFEVTLFSNPPGSSDNDNDYPIRLVLSQFYFNIAQQPYGFPDGQSDCAKCKGPWCATCTGSMPYWPAYNASAVGYDGPVYTHVHRDAAIVAAMRAWMQLPSLEAEPKTPLIAGPVPQGIFA